MESCLMLKPKSSSCLEVHTLAPISWSSLHYKSLVRGCTRITSESEFWRNTDGPLGYAAENYLNAWFLGTSSVSGIVVSWKGHKDKQNTTVLHEHNIHKQRKWKSRIIRLKWRRISTGFGNSIALKLFQFQEWTWAYLQVKVDFIGTIAWKSKYWKGQWYSGVTESTGMRDLDAVMNFLPFQTCASFLPLFLCRLPLLL